MPQVITLERLMIIAGESSGELYGALLAGNVKAIFPDARITGVGGDRMASAGVELISRISSSFGFSEAIRSYRDIKNTFRKVVEALTIFRPQVIVLIDYPDFNIRIAAEAKKAGIKVLYYVSPQVWAWRRGRIHTISKVVDKMAVLLPFEEDLYRETGLPCEFVGHPVMDEIREMIRKEGFGLKDIGSPDLKGHMKRKLGLDVSRPVFTVMPGSRHHEVSRLLPVLSRTVAGMLRRYPDYQCVVPVAPNIDKKLFETAVLPEECRLIQGRAIEALTASDVAVIASGTSTLQAALLGVPMVVVYKLSLLTSLVGWLLIKVSHISLANLLLEKSIPQDTGLRVKELLQFDASAANILAELAKIIENRSYRDEILSQLSKVRGLYGEKEASQRVAEIVTELVRQ